MAINVFDYLPCNLSPEQKRKITRIFYNVYSIITVGFFALALTLDIKEYKEKKTNLSVINKFTDTSIVASLYICPDTNDVFMKYEYEKKEKKSLDIGSEPSLEQILPVDKILEFTPHVSDVIEECEMRDKNLQLKSFSKEECYNQIQVFKKVTSGSVCYNIETNRTNVESLLMRGMIGFDPKAPRVLESITLNSKLFKNVKKMAIFYAFSDQLPVEEFITAPLIDREYDNVTGQYRYSQFSIRYSMENTTYLKNRPPYCGDNTNKFGEMLICLQDRIGLLWKQYISPYGFHSLGNQTVLAASAIGSKKDSKHWYEIFEYCEEKLKTLVECIDRKMHNSVEERSKSDKIKIVTLLQNLQNQFWTYTPAMTWQDLWNNFMSNAGAFLGMSIIGILPFYFDQKKWDETKAQVVPTMIAAVAAAKWLAALRKKKEEREETTARDVEAGDGEQENVGGEIRGTSSFRTFGDRRRGSNRVGPGRIAFHDIVNQVRGNELKCLKDAVDQLSKRFKNERDGLQTWRADLEKRLKDELKTNKDTLKHYLDESLAEFRPRSPSPQPGPSTSEPEVTEQRVRQLVSDNTKSVLSSVDLKIRHVSQRSERRLDMAEGKIKALENKHDEWRKQDAEKLAEVKDALIRHRRQIDAALLRTTSIGIPNEIKQRLETAEGKLKELETELNQWRGTDSQKLEKIQKDLDAHKRRISAIRQIALMPTPPNNVPNDLEPAMEALNKKVQELAEKVTSVNSGDIANLRSAIDEVNDRLAITTQNLEEWKKQYENLTKQSYSQRALVNILSELDDDSLRRFSDSLKYARSRFLETEAALNEHKAELQEKVEELTKRFDEGVENLTRWQESFESQISEQLATEREEQQAIVDQRLEAVDKKLDVIKEEKSSVDKKTGLHIANLEQTIHSQQEEIRSQRNEIRLQQNEIRSQREAIQSLQLQFQSVEELKRIVQQQAASVSEQQDNLRSKDQELDKLRKRSDNVDKTLKQHEDVIRSQEQSIWSQNESMAEMKRIVQQQAESVTEFSKLSANGKEDQEETSERIIAGLAIVNQRLVSVNDRLVVLEEKPSVDEQLTKFKIMALEQAIRTLEQTNQSQEQSIWSQNESMAEMKRFVLQQAASVTELRNNLRSKDPELDKLRKCSEKMDKTFKRHEDVITYILNTIFPKRKGTKSVQDTESKKSRKSIGAEGVAKDAASGEGGANEPSVMDEEQDDGQDFVNKLKNNTI